MSGRFAKRVRRNQPAPRAATVLPPPRDHGRVNAYVCQTCGAATWTTDLDRGVTPFMIGCKATPDCEGVAHSSFYRVPPDHPAPTHYWYKPTEAFARKQDARWPGMYDHWKNGGLTLRAFSDPTQDDATQ